MCVEAAVEQPTKDPSTLEGAETLPTITQAVIRDLANHFETLEPVARANLSLLTGVPARTEVRTRRELTDGFLRDIAARYQAHLERGDSPTQMIMREERVSRRTVRYWLQRARAAGHLKETTTDEKGS